MITEAFPLCVCVRSIGGKAGLADLFTLNLKCHFNKEEILKKMFHELWIVFKRPFSAHEIQTCENILRDFDNSKLTTEKPELFWGRFFVPDSSGWVTRDEAEELAEELCGLINITVNVQYEFEHR